MPRPHDARRRSFNLAFYTVCDRKHFLGLVGLINSLRLQGHDDPVYVLDRGLDDWQHDALGGQAVIVSSSDTTPPTLLKHLAPLQHPADVMVIADVDLIFTGNIHSLAAQVHISQKPVFFSNDWVDRFYPEWEAFGFGPPVRHPYVNAGLMILPVEDARHFLNMLALGQERLDLGQTLFAPDLVRPLDPFFYADQDVLNAMLGTVVALDDLTIAPETAVSYWPFPGLRLADSRTLRCEFGDGAEPMVLHHILAKPWSGKVAPSVYSRCLTRLLCGPDVAVRVPVEALPRHLHATRSAPAFRHWLSGKAWLRSRIRGKLGIRRQLRRRRLVAVRPPADVSPRPVADSNAGRE